MPEHKRPFTYDCDVVGVLKRGYIMNFLSNKWYDVLKWCAIVALPALSTFTVIISKIYGFEDVGIMVSQTITAVAVLLGALLGISAINYKDGNEK